MLAAWDKRISIKARQVFYAKRVGKDFNDVEQDLRVTLLKLWRKHHYTHARAPDAALMHCALNRHQMNAVRGTLGAAGTLVRTGVDDLTLAAGSSRDPDPVEARTRRQVELTAVDAIRRTLAPRAMAILDLRCSQNVRGCDIAAAVGMTPRQVADELSAARRQAAEVLNALGIVTTDDLDEVAPEDLSHD